MDRTVLYRELVRLALDGPEFKAEGAREPGVVEPDAFTVEIDKIAANLSRLQASLHQIRPRYLAVSGRLQMQDAERDDFDYRVRSLLQQEQRRVRALEQREESRYEQSKPQGLASWLGPPEAAGVSETLAKHRRGMCVYINFQLQRASAALSELQQVRSARIAPVRTQPLNVLPKQPSSQNESFIQTQVESVSENPAENPATNPALGESGAFVAGQELLLEEHDELLEELNATLEKAQRAEQSLREVAELQTELSQHLSMQTQQLDSLTDDVFRTSHDVTSANEQLERAKRSNRRASRIIIVSSLATGVFLLLLNGR